MLHREGKKAIAFLLVFCLLFSIALPMNVQAAGEADLKNLATGISYSIDDGVANAGVLTDGVYSQSEWNDLWYKSQLPPPIPEGTTKETSIVFDLGEQKTIEKLKSNYSNAGYGIASPKEVKYLYSEDGTTWSGVYTDTNRATQSVWQNQGAIYAQYVKLIITQDDEWLYIDEIEIWGYDDGYKPGLIVTPSTTLPTQNDITVTVTANVYNNGDNGIEVLKVAAGSHDAVYFSENGTDITSASNFIVNENGTYTVYVKDTLGNEQVKTIDISNILVAGYRNLVQGKPYSTLDGESKTGKLTDQVFGGINAFDSNWERFQNGVDVYFTFDLGESKDIRKISANLLSKNNDGVFLPNTVKYYSSEDGVNWNEFYNEIPNAGNELGAEKMEWNGYDLYSRYIKVQLLSDTEWTYIDEVEIWGEEVADLILNISASTTEITSEDVEITVSAKTFVPDNQISVLKWAEGTQNADYFNVNGNNIDLLDNSFAVQKNGIYTVYAKDILGNEVLKTIEIANIVPTGYKNLAAGMD